MDTHIIYFNLEFKYILKDRTVPYLFETSNGLWKHKISISYLQHFSEKFDIVENLTDVYNAATELSRSGNGLVSVVQPSYSDKLDYMTVIIKGSENFINYARSEIMKTYSQLSFKLINLTDKQFSQIDSSFCNKLNLLATKYNIEVLLKDNQLQIIGNTDSLTLSEIQIKLLIDSSLNNYLIEALDINLSTIPILGGSNLANFNEIAKHSNSNIYIPDLLPELFNSQTYLNNDVKLWMSSKKTIELLETRKTLADLISKVDGTELIVKSLQVSKEKLDLITLFDQTSVLKIMFENGTFIQLPSLGESSNVVLVQGNSSVAIEETINEFSALTAKYYKILLSTSTTTNDKPFDNFIVRTMAHFNCTVKTNDNGIEIIGAAENVKTFIQQMNFGFPIVKANFFLEMSTKEKDFISGKKNGKIMKILNQFGSKNAVVKFLPLNEHNFLINLVLEKIFNISPIIKLINLVELELPSELKCNIPEIFHKSIIGNGGMIIQSIMKKYNVYIKFSNENKDNDFFYSFHRLNNVLIKCPRKNASNIPLVKNELDQLIVNCLQNNLSYDYLSKNLNNSIYNSVNFTLLKSHYLLLINNFKLNAIKNLEFEYQSFSSFPKSIEDFQGKNKMVLNIKGNDIKLKIFTARMLEIIPKTYRFRITSNKNFSEVINSNNETYVQTMLIPFKIFYNIEIDVINTSHHDEIWLSYFEGNENLQFAIDRVTEILRDNQFLIIDKSEFKFNPVEQEVIQDTKHRNVRRKRPLGGITNEVN